MDQGARPSVVAHYPDKKMNIPYYLQKIGQFPTLNGLFAQPRLAYFSALQLSLTSEQPCLEFVVP